MGSVFVGCGDDDDDGGGRAGRGGTAGRGGSAGTAGQGGTAGQAGTGGLGGTAGDNGDAAVTVSDNQIAGIMQAANLGEIAQAEAALAAGVSGRIQTFANRMIAGHTAALDALNALLASDGGAGDGGDGGTLTPEPSNLRAALEATTAEIIDSLQGDAGAGGDGGRDVNQIYISSQVLVHQTLLTQLDTVLIPQADDAGLRTYLQDVRGDVQAHLDEARPLAGDPATD